MNIARTQLDQIANRIVTEGFAGLHQEISRVAQDANAAGVNAVLLAVLTDDRAPDIARARAFGMVTGAMTHGARADAGHHEVDRSPDHSRSAVSA